MTYDHNWDVAQYPIDVLSDSTAYNYVSGTAWHCYAGNVKNQSIVYNKFPAKEHYFTECSGSGDSNFAGNIPWNTQNLYIGSTDNWASMVLHCLVYLLLSAYYEHFFYNVNHGDSDTHGQRVRGDPPSKYVFSQPT